MNNYVHPKVNHLHRSSFQFNDFSGFQFVFMSLSMQVHANRPCYRYNLRSVIRCQKLLSSLISFYSFIWCTPSIILSHSLIEQIRSIIFFIMISVIFLTFGWMTPQNWTFLFHYFSYIKPRSIKYSKLMEFCLNIYFINIKWNLFFKDLISFGNAQFNI